MERHLNLIKTGVQEREKRVFPRFPFTYLTFKNSKSGGDQHVFEVVDISYTGMQVCLKDGSHTYTPGKDIDGTVHWRSANLEAKRKVQWVSGTRIGVVFDSSDAFYKEVRNFLSIDNIMNGMRAIHNSELDLEIPSNLKYWLRSDGPVELFVWTHNDGELSRFQMIIMENFVEWEDGKGVKTGRVVTKRDLETPLMTEDEFEFEMDDTGDSEKIEFAQKLISRLPEDYLPLAACEFIKLKLGA